MLEWQVEEPSQIHIHGLVEADVQRLVSEVTRQRVGSIGMSGASVAIPRELIQQDQQRQHSLRVFRPGVQIAASGGEVGRLEPSAELRVEDIILGEPF